MTPFHGSQLAAIAAYLVLGTEALAHPAAMSRPAWLAAGFLVAWVPLCLGHVLTRAGVGVADPARRLGWATLMAATAVVLLPWACAHGRSGGVGLPDVVRAAARRIVTASPWWFDSFLKVCLGFVLGGLVSAISVPEPYWPARVVGDSATCYASDRTSLAFVALERIGLLRLTTGTPR